MIKQNKYIFEGMNQDVIEDKHPFKLYFEANNIRVITTDSQSQGGVTNEKGNSLLISLPSPQLNISNNKVYYGNEFIKYSDNNQEIKNGKLPINSEKQIIINATLTKEGFVIFSTDNKGFDCIWEVTLLLEESHLLKLKYCRNLSFSTSKPIQAIFNYENENIQKVYWVDSNSQLRFINLKHSILNKDVEELIDLNSNSINIVGDYSLSQPKLVSLSGGGNNTSGMSQYSYNLYKLNGAQTTISPSSELIPLDNGLNLGGGLLNEVVGVSPQLKISTLDNNYTHIKIYAIKYTSYNNSPSISLIVDEEISTYQDYKFIDDGNKISTLSLSEFLFLGSNPIIPEHIEAKDNILFAASYKENAYDLEIDTRAYSHTSSGECRLFTGNINYINSKLQGSSISYTPNIAIDNYNYNKEFDAINPDYDKYKYQKNGYIVGGEGLFIRYKVLQKKTSQLKTNLKYLKALKDGEIYRIGIEFYNKFGQKSDVKWIADFKTPIGNLQGNYNMLSVEIKSQEFNNYINSLNLNDEKKPVGYRIVRALRNDKDKTILCQGSMTGMMVQTTRDKKNWKYWNIKSNREKESELQVKTPIPITRGFSIPSGENSIFPTEHLKQMNEGRDEGFDEIYRDNNKSYKRQQSWQYTKMIQIHSPDIIFNTGLVFSGGLELHVKGIANYTQTNKIRKQIQIDSKTVTDNDIENNKDNLKFEQKQFGFIGPIYDGDHEGETEFRSYNRKYLKFQHTSEKIYKPIFRIPEIAERGQGVTSYNGDSNFNYSNTLEGLITDAYKGSSRDDKEIRGINTFGSKCGILVLGSSTQNESTRPSLESLVPSDINSNNGLLIGEIRRPVSYIYNGGIYGGLTLEDKTRTSYIAIGDYKKITDNFIEIENAGDTFVQLFKFARLSKTDTEIYDVQKMQFTEIVEHTIETSINLLNRSDSSIFNWDNKFQPKYNEFHNYNRIYSQESNLIKSATDSFKFKKVKYYKTRIISSKVKVPGEIIDSWTDFLENETIELDGKYGPIRSLINWNDNIYVLQDFAVAFVSINPRVQTQGSDGISVELGSGKVLHDYNYISTNSGTLNKWSVVKTPNGFYYIDIVNKCLYFVSGNKLQNISMQKGLDSFFKNNLEYNELVNDNPYLKKGINSGYDSLHNTVMFTVLQNNNSFTLSFNEKTQLFESFYDYKPSLYISRGSKLLSLSPDNNKMYEHFTGNYNEFYGEKYPSSITIQVHSKSNDAIFNNIAYKAKTSLNGIDNPLLSFNKIRAWNEYQDTNIVSLVLNKNISRKFRMWKANIPRSKVNNNNSLDRIRGQWMKLMLQFDNPNNHKLILHDTDVFYTSYNN